MSHRPEQFDLDLRSRRPRRGHGWGGRRPGAGRKRAPNSGVAHRARPPLAARHPVHISLKIRAELPSLRSPRCLEAVQEALRANAQQSRFRVCHFSLLGHHIHLIVEAADANVLSRRMQSLMIRMARKLNRTWGRSGKVFADRYFARPLKTPREAAQPGLATPWTADACVRATMGQQLESTRYRAGTTSIRSMKSIRRSRTAPRAIAPGTA